jgi:hypothetical protein
MLGAGIEPAWVLAQGILSPSRLPVSPPEPDDPNLRVGPSQLQPLAGLESERVTRVPDEIRDKP